MKGVIWSIVFTAVISTGTTSYANQKPIVIITQDGEVDDRSSFVRLLLYSPDIDLRGIIATNSKWQKNGHGLDWINEVYELYGKVRANLLLHDPAYPSVTYLKSITRVGNEDEEHLTGVPPYADSEGAELIINELRKLKDELLHINCWGGVNTVAHALWKFKKKYPLEFRQQAPKVRLITIDFQDEAGDWIVQNMPEIRVIRNNAFHMTWNYHSIGKPLLHNPHPNFMSEAWLNENVKSDHGPLGAWYPQDNVSEGDTPAFLNFVNNGLKAYEDYGSGGWGGRYSFVNANYWLDAADDSNRHKTLWRWIPAVQNDFAARMDWCTKRYEEANHSPVISEVIAPKVVTPGQKVELRAFATDPDSNHVYYHWWHYAGPSHMVELLMIAQESSSSAYFVVPESGSSDIHIILEVTDDGSPALKSYRRLIFHVDQ